uniref:Uncharacterized protein n=2 Tax=Lotharella globosa TaxID=91324 RepID=A0A7S4DVL0_9EUKA
MIASTVPAVGNGIVETPYGNEYTNGRNCSVEAPCSYSGPLNSSTAQNYWAIAGFGNAQLASALWFAGDPHRLHFSDRRFLFPSDRHCYAVDNLKASSYLTAVLVWTDPAASPIAAKALVNDLDLRVTLHSTSAEEEDQIFLGNADYTNSTCRDSLNNVEKVTIRPGGASASSSSSATVVVEASAVVLGAAQNYALVVLLPATAAFEPVPCDDDAMSSTTSADFECDATT